MIRTRGIIRLTPLLAAMRRVPGPLTGGLCLVLSQIGSGAASAEWDCRADPATGDWQCAQDGTPVSGPARASAQHTESPHRSPEEGAPAPHDEPPVPIARPAPPGPVVDPVATPLSAATPSVPSPAVPPPIADAQPPVETGPGPLPPTEAPSSPAPAAAIESLPGAGPDKPAHESTHRVDPVLQSFRYAASPDPSAAGVTPRPRPAPATPGSEEPLSFAALSGSHDPRSNGAIDDGIDWNRCRAPGDADLPRAPTVSDPANASAAPLEVSADAVIAHHDPQRAEFRGDVVLVQDGLEMRADTLRLDRSTGEVDAEGGFLINRPDIRIGGDAAHYQLATGQGNIEQATYRVPGIGARGDARQAEFLGEGRSRFDDISYSTCRPGEDDWLLSAQTLELDQAEGLGTAHHASLQFMGVPLLYTPWFTFPIDDRRRSGLLIPTLGYNDNTGLDLSVPYYLNLAENYDLTLTPRLMSRRGLMLGGEFRFLTETTQGTLEGEYLPNDLERPGSRQDRGSASLRSHTRLADRAAADLRLGYVSDNDYLEDLGDNLATTSASHIERTGELHYQGDHWRLLGRLQGYQTIDDDIARSDRPYSRLPQLLLDLEHPDALAGLSYHLGAEYVNFYREDSVRGHRIALTPALSLPLRRTWGYLEPKLGAHYTGYQLTDLAVGQNDDPSHLTGLFSLDAGLFFDREASWFGESVNQTLEPRLFYLLVPEDGQNDQPVFDTAAYDFSFDNLFRENRFNGPDRVGDANQLTLALTSRMIGDRSGTELLRASIGQILYFEDRKVRLPGEPTVRDNASAVVGELAARLGGGWRTRAGLQWNPHDGDNGTIDQALAQISYRDDHQRVFNAAYRLRDGVTQHTDLAAIWPLNERLSLIGRHHYSLREDRLLEALAGIEYGRCCWRLRALLRQYTDSDNDDHNLTFLIQLELNGLGRLGNKIDQTLEHGIYGYRTNAHD